MDSDLFIPFGKEAEGIPLPDKFTFPFFYDPHPLSLLACKWLQDYIKNKVEWADSFGTGPIKQGYGKMFGVLVVKNKSGQLGFLKAFSGKFSGTNFHSGFVPPVFNLLVEDGFYKIGEEKINVVNRRVLELESDPKFIALKSKLSFAKVNSVKEINDLKLKIKDNKNSRASQRDKFDNLEFEEAQRLLFQLNKESISESYTLKDLISNWKKEIQELEFEINVFKNEIDALKVQRKQMSYLLQKEIFNRYSFLNFRGELKDLNEIFNVIDDGTPPSGAGECAAPKLFQYAFMHNYLPIALAEFWWGASPLSEIRKHGQFYPACKGKCEPILNHMLQGLELDDNPLLINPAVGKELEYVFEDDFIVVVNKPAEFLSVPGRAIHDSVATRLREKYPDATGPLCVHRLDMSTSGLILSAKTIEAHNFLQRQFIKRTIKKRYVALLEGVIESKEGLIDLPLRLDIDNRPTQLVDMQYGKPAQTRYEVIDITNGKTKIQFYPITGRTHQLRVHASHPLGLNTPILGDDLYGKKGGRLYLHAEFLEFIHPGTKEKVSFEVQPNW
jgi:tRNA pseudouridine32 synthase / 23S rRNA pseudouridine746 synthase